MKTVIDDPNFSVLMPGGCNANCSFCWYKYDASKELDPETWLASLSTVHTLPEQFKQVSVTGGEPTLNPVLLRRALRILRSRFDKVVLTTNGTCLTERLRHIVRDGLVDYINISRHSPYQQVNKDIFKTDIPGSSAVRSFIAHCHKHAVPVTINCVVTKQFKFKEMIDYCKKVEAYALKLRAQSTDEVVEKAPTWGDMTSYKPIYQEKSGVL